MSRSKEKIKEIMHSASDDLHYNTILGTFVYCPGAKIGFKIKHNAFCTISPLWSHLSTKAAVPGVINCTILKELSFLII